MMLRILELDGWKANIKFSATHVIPDFKICGRLHGHTYAVHARLHGEPGPSDIVMDFGLLKKTLRDIADALDHRVLIPENSKTTRVEGEAIKLTIGDKRYVLPKSDCVLLPLDTTSAESLSQYVLDRLVATELVPEKVTQIDIGVDEGPGQGAWASWRRTG